jgi:hypothetical protein
LDVQSSEVVERDYKNKYNWIIKHIVLFELLI